MINYNFIIILLLYKSSRISPFDHTYLYSGTTILSYLFNGVYNTSYSQQIWCITELFIIIRHVLYNSTEEASWRWNTGDISFETLVRVSLTCVQEQRAMLPQQQPTANWWWHAPGACTSTWTVCLRLSWLSGSTVKVATQSNLLAAALSAA